MIAEERISVPVLSDSKKIKKPISPEKKASQSSKQEPKRYAVYAEETKKHVIMELKRAILKKYHTELQVPIAESTNELWCIEQASMNHFNEYNDILKEVLIRNKVGDIGSKNSDLCQWRKKIKSWAKNLGRSETRGGSLIPTENQEWFREQVIRLLHHLPCRSWKLLRMWIISLLSQQGVMVHIGGFSKFWWLSYKNKNPEIMNIWNSLPLKENKEKTPERWKDCSQTTASDPFLPMDERRDQERFPVDREELRENFVSFSGNDSWLLNETKLKSSLDMEDSCDKFFKQYSDDPFSEVDKLSTDAFE